MSLLVGGCTSPAEVVDTHPEIIHGDPVTASEYPTIGLVMTVGKVGRMGMPAVRSPITLCTGTLISPTDVLLAAHCVDTNLLKIQLLLQGITLEGELEFKFTFEHSISNFIKATSAGNVFDEKPSLLAVTSTDSMPLNTSSNTRPGEWDDIALLHLAAPVKGHPIQLLATTAEVDLLAEGSAHLVAGYGQTSNDPGDFNGDGVEDPVAASAGTLHSGKSKLNTMGDHELIAGDMDDQQACHGDSGGPIFLDETSGKQLGIASRINLDPTMAMPGTQPRCEPGLLYTRVDAYLDWIKQHAPTVGQTTEPCAPNDPAPTCGSGSTTAGPDMAMGGGTSGGGGKKDDGCGCSIGGAPRTATSGAWMLLLAGAGFVVLRRRRRA